MTMECKQYQDLTYVKQGIFIIVILLLQKRHLTLFNKMLFNINKTLLCLAIPQSPYQSHEKFTLFLCFPFYFLFCVPHIHELIKSYHSFALSYTTEHFLHTDINISYVAHSYPAHINFHLIALCCFKSIQTHKSMSMGKPPLCHFNYSNVICLHSYAT